MLLPDGSAYALFKQVYSHVCKLNKRKQKYKLVPRKGAAMKKMIEPNCQRIPPDGGIFVKRISANDNTGLFPE